jgi:hypothetical protein
MDGSYTKEMFEQTRRSGMNIEEFYGDKAYFRKPILDQVIAIDAEPFIPVSSTVYRIDEEKFAYNKDSDEWQCRQGNITVKKKHYTSNREDGVRQS